MTSYPGLICRECKGEHPHKPHYACEEQRSLNPPFTSSARFKVFCSGRFAVQNKFEIRIKSSEKEAWKHCYSGIQAVQQVRLSNWFHGLLAGRIVPALRRIGFDEIFAWALFHMAGPAWELMGPITHGDIWFNPPLARDIEEARNGVLEKSRRQYECLSLLKSMNPEDFRFHIQAGMGPRDLFSLLEDISTSWIILPRAYNHLEENHSQCLLGYLKWLDNEKDASFGKILARIITEFVGNYSIKHMSETHPRDTTVAAIFWGYAAMFWRSLRKPPAGLEDAGIFENFLYWVKRFRHRSASISQNMTRMIENMEEAKDEALPNVDAFGLGPDGSSDAGRFLITLRHGHPGIKAALRYFGIGGSLAKHSTDGRLPYASVPAALSVLFREVKRSYPMETLRTQESIRQFLSDLRVAYESKPMETTGAGYESSEQLRFVRSRVLGMINDLINLL